MSDDDEIEIHLHVTYASHLDMDEATKNPRYVAAEPLPLASSPSAMEHA
jgi:hypothetical protein